ncbi:MAG: hypothetical protein WC707_01445 [Candidatus Babeliaceae bacterium]
MKKRLLLIVLALASGVAINVVHATHHLICKCTDGSEHIIELDRGTSSPERTCERLQLCPSGVRFAAIR